MHTSMASHANVSPGHCVLFLYDTMSGCGSRFNHYIQKRACMKTYLLSHLATASRSVSANTMRAEPTSAGITINVTSEFRPVLALGKEDRTTTTSAGSGCAALPQDPCDCGGVTTPPPFTPHTGKGTDGDNPRRSPMPTRSAGGG